jgi:hypothetical protein
MEDIEDQLPLNSVKNITIEAGASGVVWRCPDKPAEGSRPLISFIENEGLRIQGLTFDGRGLVDDVLLLSGNCPGLTIKDCVLCGFKRYGILISNCAGSSGREVSLEDLQIIGKDAEAGLAFGVNPSFKMIANNAFLRIHGCRFNGSFKNPVTRLAGAPAPASLSWEDNFVGTKSLAAPK